MNIKDKTIDQVAARVETLLEKFCPQQPYSATAVPEIVDKETYEALIELLSINGQLTERFKGVINLMDSIKENIKKKNLPAGKYGVTYPLKVSAVQKTEVYVDKVIKAIEEANLDVKDYMVLDLKNAYVENLVKNNPSFSGKTPNYNKHTFG